MDNRLSEKWIKASIIGTIWAASEIVLGSFLHNLRIPFSGNILTAIGLIILISISYIWSEKGLFWRAGLICAVMKTMSPSAVIFGPMIAIFAESVLLELSVRLLGRTIPGYAIGAMLAMSWNLFQKIGGYIIYYGSNIIDVYTNLLQMAQRQLKIQTDIVWLPIILLLVVYALFGLFAAGIGIRVGRKMLKEPHEIPLDKRDESTGNITPSAGIFNYSVVWLFANVVLIISSFFLLSNSPWYVWSAAIAMIVVVWSARYRRAMRQLTRPKFWIFFVVITLITAFVFAKVGEGESVWVQGLLTGIQMNFRAVVIIVGFSALGTELYNPAVRNFFMKTSFRNLPLAVELSVESLPDFIATIPDFKSLVKNPVSIFYKVLSHAGSRLSEIKAKNRRFFIVTGGRGEGKTTFTKKLIDFLKEHKIIIAGILAERIMEGGETTGYDIVNIETGDRECFLTLVEKAGNEWIGKYTVCPNGISYGKSVLHSQVNGSNKTVVIDEIGMLELRGGGWSENLDDLVNKSGNHLLLVVRDEFVEQVKARWKLSDAVVFNINETNPVNAGEMVLKLL